MAKKRRDNFDSGRGYVKPSGGSYMLNQKVNKFGDKRTKRDRDRSSQNRNAIRRSSEGL